MSLLRLLTAGKCLVGNDNNSSRYRMSKPGAMPKFGSSTQFRSTESSVSAEKETGDVRPISEECESAEGADAKDPISVEESQACLAKNGASDSLPGGVSSDHSGVGSLEPEPTHLSSDGSTAAKVPGGEVGQRGKIEKIHMTFGTATESGRVGQWARRLWARLTGFGSRAPRKLDRPVTAPDEKRFVQTELSLDMVQVVRNDLSDTDLEIVPQASLPEAKSKPGRVGIANNESASLASAERA